MDSNDRERQEGTGIKQWLSPQTLLPIICMALAFLSTFVVQQERVESLRLRIEAVERDYQRRDVLAEQLRNINDRLYAIEQKLGDRSPLIR